MPDTQSSHPVWGARFIQFWRLLIEPAAAVRDSDARLRARLLSAILILLLPCVTLIIGYWVLYSLTRGHGLTRNSLIALIAWGLWGALYGISRTRHYHRAAQGVVLLLSVAVFLIALPDSEYENPVNMHLYYVLVVMFSSILLAPRTTALLIAVLLGSMVVYPVLFPSVHLGELWTGFVALNSIAIGVGITYIRRLNQRRQIALETSDARMRAMLEAFPDLIFRMDAEGVFLDCETGDSTLLYLPQEDFIGRPVTEVMPPDVAQNTMTRVKRALETREIQISEYLLEKDGRTYWSEARTVPLTDREVLTFVRDITDRKLATTALDRSETQHHAVLEAIPDLIFRFNRQGVFQGYQPSKSGMAMPPDLFINRSICDVLPEIAEQTLQAITTALDTNTIQIFNYQLALDGEPRNYEARISPSGDDEVVTIVRDVTTSKRAEEALRTSEARYRMLFEESPTVLWEEDFSAVKPQLEAWRAAGVDDLAAHLDENPDRIIELARLVRVINVNQATLAHFKVDHKEPLLGDLAQFIQQEPTRRLFCNQVLAFAAGERQFRADLTRTGDDGIMTASIITATIAPEHADTWARVYVSVVDITEQKRAQTAECEQRALAEALRDITALITSTLDQEQILDRVLALIERVVPCEAAHIALLEGGVARMVRRKGYSAPDLDGETIIVMPVADFPVLQAMIATRDSLLIPDTTDDPRWVQRVPGRVMQSYVGAPIFWEDHVAGFIGLESVTPRFFTPDHAERLQAFANQVAMALRNAQLYKAVQRHVRELETLHRATLDFTSQLRLDQLLHTLTERALTLIDAPAGGIYLHREGGDELEWAVTVGPGLIPVGARLKRGEGLSGKVWEQGRTMIVDNYTIWSGRHAGYEGCGLIYDAVIAVPIYWQGQLLGVINAAADASQRTFTTHDTQLLELFAAHAAIAIQNARLFNAEHEQRTLSDTLRATVAALNRTLDLDTVLEQLLDATARVVPHDAANIMLFEDDHAVIAYHRGYEAYSTAEWINQRHIPLKDLIITIGPEARLEQHIIPDTHTDARWQQNSQSDWIRSLLCAPIQIEDEILGILNLDSATPNHFTRHHLLHAQAFADQAALAIRNARLFAEVRRHRDHLERTVEQRTVDLTLRNTVAETLSSSLDLDAMLYGVLKIVAQRLEVCGGAIYLIEETNEELILSARHGVAPSVLELLDPNSTMSHLRTQTSWVIFQA